MLSWDASSWQLRMSVSDSSKMRNGVDAGAHSGRCGTGKHAVGTSAVMQSVLTVWQNVYRMQFVSLCLPGCCFWSAIAEAYTVLAKLAAACTKRWLASKCCYQQDIGQVCMSQHSSGTFAFPTKSASTRSCLNHRDVACAAILTT